jgi:hypothetical protein
MIRVWRTLALPAGNKCPAYAANRQRIREALAVEICREFSRAV